MMFIFCTFLNKIFELCKSIRVGYFICLIIIILMLSIFINLLYFIKLILYATMFRIYYTNNKWQVQHVLIENFVVYFSVYGFGNRER